MIERAIMPYTYVASGLSDMGRVRDNNEDVWAEIEELNFFLLADGMGGHQAGEVASREAASHMLRLVRKAFKTTRKKSLSDACKAIKQAIILVNTLVYKLGRSQEELKGMGTTLCAVLLHDDGAILAHVGDSRIYRLRDGSLEQMTKDHSLFRKLVDLGQLSEQFAPDFAYKNIITKAIGTESKVEPTVFSTDIQIGDYYLLCTDGLSDLLSLKEIETLMRQDISVDQMAECLIIAANDRGGHDNVTVVLIKVDDYQNLSR